MERRSRSNSIELMETLREHTLQHSDVFTQQRIVRRRNNEITTKPKQRRKSLNDLPSVEKLLSIDSEILHKLSDSRRNSLRSDPSTGQIIEEEEEIEYDESADTCSDVAPVESNSVTTTDVTPQEAHDHLASIVLVNADVVTTHDIGEFVIGTNPTVIPFSMRDKSCEIVYPRTANHCLHSFV